MYSEQGNDSSVTQTPPNERQTPRVPSPEPTNAIAPIRSHPWLKRFAGLTLLVVLAVAGTLTWKYIQPKGLGVGFASGNGRIEAVEYDIAAKSPGRISEMLVNDGDFVDAGQVLVRMDTEVLQAQLQQAKAQETQARNAVATALAVVLQHESEQAAARAVVTAREAERDAAEETAQRSQLLSAEHAVSIQEYENDLARQKGSAAAVLAAKAQVAAAQATITASRSQVLEARSRVDAAIATEKSLLAEIHDSDLKAARAGRVQFRIAQPGEVVAGGGKVLSMVDLSDVSMTFFLPETVAGRVAIGSEVHIVLDAVPQYVLPARVLFVADVAQFTPKTVETESERQKLVFRVKARMDPELLRQHSAQVKSGLPGVAYVRLNPSAAWPENLKIRIPQ